MATSKLPRNQDGDFVQVLGPGASINGTIAGTSANVALPGGDVVRVCTTSDCYIKFGNSGAVTAANTDPVFLKGAELFKVPAGMTHLAFLQVSSGGTISVTTME